MSSISPCSTGLACVAPLGIVQKKQWSGRLHGEIVTLARRIRWMECFREGFAWVHPMVRGVSETKVDSFISFQ